MLIEVCHTCNEKCIHCCLHEHNNNGLTLFQYEKLFDQMVEAGTLFVILTGGEPFMRSDFLDIVRSARNHYLSVTIFTNGTLLTKKIILELKKAFSKPKIIGKGKPQESMNSCGKAGCQGK